MQIAHLALDCSTTLALCRGSANHGYLQLPQIEINGKQKYALALAPDPDPGQPVRRPRAAPVTQGGANARKTFEARVKSLMTDVPDLPNFSHFHASFRGDAGTKTNEGDIRSGFYAAYDAAGCEFIRLGDPEIDRRLKAGPDLVSASFVIPYPPGFPIMVPGQVITQETIDFMRKLDVKEIHGYDAKEGLKLVRTEALAKIGRPKPGAAPRLKAAS
jgi:arginine decarboxylase